MSREKNTLKQLKEFSFESGYEFHIPGLTGTRVERDTGIIKGVAVITAGVKARGHELETDMTTLTQMLACGQRGKVPVKLNHQSGVENVIGYLTNFHVDGNKLRADWHLIKSHSQYAATMDKAEQMPECFGLSAAFVGKEQEHGGRKMARCTELLAVDCVAQPAANPDGLLSAKSGGGVDSGAEGMSTASAENTITDPNAVPAEMPAWFKPFAEQIQSISAFLQEQRNAALAQELLNMTDEDRAALSDEDLAQYGITREEIAEVNAIAAEMAGGGGAGEPGAEGATGTEGATAGAAGATAGPARSGTVPVGPGQGNTAIAALSAQIKELKQFQTRLEREKLTELQARQQAEIDETINELESKVAAAVVELKAKDAEIARLSAKVPRLRSSTLEEVHLFDARPKNGADAGQGTAFEVAVTAKYTELCKLNPNATEKQLAALKADATRFCIRKYPNLFEDHRAGSVQLERR